MLSKQEIERYARQIILPEVTLQGQERLKQAKVLVVGAGGLGCPVILYLAAAGIGNIGIVDFDQVAINNLQRQILFTSNDIGRSKSVCAAKRVATFNLQLATKAYSERLTKQNALELIKHYDVVVDATDNFATRYLLNDACFLLNKPLIYGSIYRFEGQLSVFNAGADTPCYRCLYPEPPPSNLVPSCAEGGVIGALAGIIGAMQGIEVIKIIVAAGKILSGRLFVFDSLTFNSNILDIVKDEKCALCGSDPKITALANTEYDYSCEIGPFAVKTTPKSISPVELKKLLAQNASIKLIDVREHSEAQISTIGGKVVPLHEFEKDSDAILEFIPTNSRVIFYCKDGRRSSKAIMLLEEKYGMTNLYHLDGGLDMWILEIDQDLPRY